jgi:hypothetical protein
MMMATQKKRSQQNTDPFAELKLRMSCHNLNAYFAAGKSKATGKAGGLKYLKCSKRLKNLGPPKQ